MSSPLSQTILKCLFYHSVNEYVLTIYYVQQYSKAFLFKTQFSSMSQNNILLHPEYFLTAHQSLKVRLS